jgi:SNF2 family DNA or RNA helicase
LAPLQIALYRRVAQSKQATAALRSVSTLSSSSSSSSSGGGAFALQVMTSLRKICSHPALLWAEARDGAPDADSRFAGMHALYPRSYAASMEKLALSSSADDDDHESDGASSAAISSASACIASGGGGASPSFSIADLSIGDSGKLRALDELLLSIRTASPGDRCVIVSTHTTTLDLIERLCAARGYSSLRLDGRVRPALRQSLVNRFNAAWSEDFVFLLSAKAGGVGLNLIGANRCILFDPDWNPAVDEQCMARCWREGQRKTVYIYRLLSRGTVEEAIFQRQIKKNEFQISESSGEAEHAASSSSSSNSNATSSVRHFSADDLRECFTLHHSVAHCRTFDLMLDVQRMQQQQQQQTQNLAKFLGAATSGNGSGLVASTASANRQLRDGPFALSEWSFCSQSKDIEVPRHAHALDRRCGVSCCYFDV